MRTAGAICPVLVLEVLSVGHQLIQSEKSICVYPMQKTINLLLMTLIFPPDGVSSAQLLGEIVEDLGAGDNVSINVITTTPHYNHDENAKEAQPIIWVWHRLYGKSQFHRAKVWHIRMPKKARSAVMRSAQWLWFHLVSLLLALSMCRKTDILLTVSPPPTITVVAVIMNKLFKTPFVYVMWELYPQILVTLGHLKTDSWLYKVLVRLEKLTYQEADRIVVLHEPMRQAVGCRVPAALKKTCVIPTFADVTYLKPMSKETTLRQKYSLQNKFVVGYAGNLGSSEDLGIVLKAAQKSPGVAFLICGDGTEKQRLENFARSSNLKNVIFTGHLPYDMVPEITATADVSLVVLSEGVGDEALPSKVYKVMACGRPVLAIASENSPLASLVLTLKVGRAVTDYNPSSLVRVIEEMSADEELLLSMGEQARASAVELFSRDTVTSKYRRLISTTARQ